MCLLTNALRGELPGVAEDLPGNDNSPQPCPPQSLEAATADHFRKLAVWLLLASIVIAIIFAVALKVPVDPAGSSQIECVIAALLLVSRIWWVRSGHERAADAAGTVGVICLGGMAGGAIAMLELALHLPLIDGLLWSFDRALGFNGITIVELLSHQGQWLFSIMAPAYNYTIPLFLAGVVAVALRGDRVEAWRAALCFVGTLLTTCLIAIFTPAKGLGMWASPDLFARLPDRAMRSFWPHFDSFYFGADPVLRVQVIDGVISFPSFHAIVGFLVVAMWRKNVVTLIAASLWLAIMLLATLPGGGHYLVDLIAGFFVWAAWFAWSRRIEAQMTRKVALVAV